MVAKEMIGRTDAHCRQRYLTMQSHPQVRTLLPVTLTSLPVHPHLPSRSPSPPFPFTLTSLLDHPHLPSRSPSPPFPITLTSTHDHPHPTHNLPHLHSRSPLPPLPITPTSTPGPYMWYSAGIRYYLSLLGY